MNKKNLSKNLKNNFSKGYFNIFIILIILLIIGAATYFFFFFTSESEVSLVNTELESDTNKVNETFAQSGTKLKPSPPREYKLDDVIVREFGRYPDKIKQNDNILELDLKLNKFDYSQLEKTFSTQKIKHMDNGTYDKLDFFNLDFLGLPYYTFDSLVGKPRNYYYEVKDLLPARKEVKSVNIYYYEPVELKVKGFLEPVPKLVAYETNYFEDKSRDYSYDFDIVSYKDQKIIPNNKVNSAYKTNYSDLQLFDLEINPVEYIPEKSIVRIYNFKIYLELGDPERSEEIYYDLLDFTNSKYDFLLNDVITQKGISKFEFNYLNDNSNLFNYNTNYNSRTFFDTYFKFINPEIDSKRLFDRIFNVDERNSGTTIVIYDDQFSGQLQDIAGLLDGTVQFQSAQGIYNHTWLDCDTSGSRYDCHESGNTSSGVYEGPIQDIPIQEIWGDVFNDEKYNDNEVCLSLYKTFNRKKIDVASSENEGGNAGFHSGTIDFDPMTHPEALNIPGMFLNATPEFGVGSQILEDQNETIIYYGKVFNEEHYCNHHYNTEGELDGDALQECINTFLTNKIGSDKLERFEIYYGVFNGPFDQNELDNWLEDIENEVDEENNDEDDFDIVNYELTLENDWGVFIDEYQNNTSEVTVEKTQLEVQAEVDFNKTLVYLNGVFTNSIKLKGLPDEYYIVYDVEDIEDIEEEIEDVEEETTSLPIIGYKRPYRSYFYHRVEVDGDGDGDFDDDKDYNKFIYRFAKDPFPDSSSSEINGYLGLLDSTIENNYEYCKINEDGDEECYTLEDKAIIMPKEYPFGDEPSGLDYSGCVGRYNLGYVSLKDIVELSLFEKELFDEMSPLKPMSSKSNSLVNFQCDTGDFDCYLDIGVLQRVYFPLHINALQVLNSSEEVVGFNNTNYLHLGALFSNLGFDFRDYSSHDTTHAILSAKKYVECVHDGYDPSPISIDNAREENVRTGSYEAGVDRDGFYYCSRSYFTEDRTQKIRNYILYQNSKHPNELLKFVLLGDFQAIPLKSLLVSDKSNFMDLFQNSFLLSSGKFKPRSTSPRNLYRRGSLKFWTYKDISELYSFYKYDFNYSQNTTNHLFLADASGFTVNGITPYERLDHDYGEWGIDGWIFKKDLCLSNSDNTLSFFDFDNPFIYSQRELDLFTTKKSSVGDIFKSLNPTVVYYSFDSGTNFNLDYAELEPYSDTYHTAEGHGIFIPANKEIISKVYQRNNKSYEGLYYSLFGGLSLQAEITVDCEFFMPRHYHQGNNKEYIFNDHFFGNFYSSTMMNSPSFAKSTNSMPFSLNAVYVVPMNSRILLQNYLENAQKYKENSGNANKRPFYHKDNNLEVCLNNIMNMIRHSELNSNSYSFYKGNFPYVVDTSADSGLYFLSNYMSNNEISKVYVFGHGNTRRFMNQNMTELVNKLNDLDVDLSDVHPVSFVTDSCLTGRYFNRNKNGISFTADHCKFLDDGMCDDLDDYFCQYSDCSQDSIVDYYLDNVATRYLGYTIPYTFISTKFNFENIDYTLHDSDFEPELRNLYYEFSRPGGSLLDETIAYILALYNLKYHFVNNSFTGIISSVFGLTMFGLPIYPDNVQEKDGTIYNIDRSVENMGLPSMNYIDDDLIVTQRYRVSTEKINDLLELKPYFCSSTDIRNLRLSNGNPKDNFNFRFVTQYDDVYCLDVYDVMGENSRVSNLVSNNLGKIFDVTLIGSNSFSKKIKYDKELEKTIYKNRDSYQADLFHNQNKLVTYLNGGTVNNLTGVVPNLDQFLKNPNIYWNNVVEFSDAGSILVDVKMNISLINELKSTLLEYLHNKNISIDDFYLGVFLNSLQINDHFLSPSSTGNTMYDIFAYGNAQFINPSLDPLNFGNDQGYEVFKRYNHSSNFYTKLAFPYDELFTSSANISGYENKTIHQLYYTYSDNYHIFDYPLSEFEFGVHYDTKNLFAQTMSHLLEDISDLPANLYSINSYNYPELINDDVLYTDEEGKIVFENVLVSEDDYFITIDVPNSEYPFVSDYFRLNEEEDDEIYIELNLDDISNMIGVNINITDFEISFYNRFDGSLISEVNIYNDPNNTNENVFYYLIDNEYTNVYFEITKPGYQLYTSDILNLTPGQITLVDVNLVNN